MRNTLTLKITTTALFSSLGIAIPLIFHMTGFAAGKLLLPMHLPVLLCGLICGPLMGACCGFIVPLLSSLLTGMPPFLPYGVPMIFELTVYGACIGLLNHISARKIKLKPLAACIISLIVAMLVGRGIWGIATSVINVVGNNTFTFKMFLTGAFISGWLGIIVQLLLIPSIYILLHSMEITQKFLPHKIKNEELKESNV